MSTDLPRPERRPRNPCFSSGPCAKRPGWSLAALAGALVGRSHRSPSGEGRLREVIERSRAVLGVPADHRIAVVPASDTGAVEMALWSLLGPRGVDVLAWESFGRGWVADLTRQLPLSDVRPLLADYGELPDLRQVESDRDVVFTWNGTTSGVRVPDADWIDPGRQGLAICDATSAVFAMDLPWEKLDVVAWSWQKVMGGEAAHGMLVLGPRAVERLTSYQPPWPLPKLFRMTAEGALDQGLFEGRTINTPSMLCVEDAIDGLRWAESIGGLPELVRRSKANLAVLEDWAENRDWIDFLAARPSIRSSTSICLRIVDGEFAALPAADQAGRVKELGRILEREGAAYDVGSYREAPPGLRVWGGSTVEASDIEALTPWLDWAFEAVRPG